MAYPDEYNPFFHVEQGFWCQKDVFSQGFLGSASRIYIEFGGTYTPAVTSDIGKTVKDDGVYSGVLVGYWNSETDYLHLPTSVDPSDPTAPTWWLVGYYPIASGSTMTIPSGTGGGVTNAGWATQPGGGAVMVGHGLTAVDDPPKMILSSSLLGFDTFWFVDIEDNLANIKVKDIECDTINGISPAVITKGSDVTDASGNCTVIFDDEFDEIPYVWLQGLDAAGKGLVIDVVSRSTTQFVVKARKVTSVPWSDSGDTGNSGVGAPSATTTVVTDVVDDNPGAGYGHIIGGYTGDNVGDGDPHYHGFGTEHGGSATSIHVEDTDTVASDDHGHGLHSHTVDVGGVTNAPVLAADFLWFAIPA